jgi:hypothetical protein
VKSVSQSKRIFFMSFSTFRSIQKASKVFISERFQQVVILHILKNNLQKIEAEVPLLLGIHGPSGEGKTFQIEQILKKMGVKRFLLSGGQMESPIPGQPAHLVRTTYIQASENKRGGGCSLAVVLINDVDTGLGSVGEMGRFTINQQAVFGELMHLVDYPGAVETGDPAHPDYHHGQRFQEIVCPLVRRPHDCLRMDPDLGRTGADRLWDYSGSRQSRCRAFDHGAGMAALRDGRSGKALTVAFFSHLRSEADG